MPTKLITAVSSGAFIGGVSALAYCFSIQWSNSTFDMPISFKNADLARGQGSEAAGLSADVRPLHLSSGEIADLVAFLKSLTAPVTITRPKVPPSIQQ
ncbi:MAG TPA: hypothetical protein VFB63_08555 [Bryobacteraceae bacterium]|nr:hypothetical protein [Bryobacteraceae bacterium]